MIRKWKNREIVVSGGLGKGLPYCVWGGAYTLAKVECLAQDWLEVFPDNDVYLALIPPMTQSFHVVVECLWSDSRGDLP